jgi:PAS domain S-box-containing protein
MGGMHSSPPVITVRSSRRDPAGGHPGPSAIILIFLLFGAIWFLLSGFLLPSLIRDPANSRGILAWKDWIFLVIAALLLYALIRHHTGRLSDSESLYRTLVENAGSIILTMDRDGNITFFNRYAEEIFGFERREVLGRNVVGTIVPGSESSGRDLDLLIQEILSTPGRFLKNRNENITSTGKRIWVLWTNRALTDAKGFVTGVISVGTDIPEEKHGR